ncbi:TPA: DUF4406 domain-containing protein [Citrobacter farmeri]|nr:DUF4406 domain-containing protein [Citrobacter farmeri]HCB1659307.1 DUF4406 domain-containing protein [Citrobacter farmeri]HCB1663792.1 DUF4406 domain-containing protein [Citrobacter farmeri]HCB1669367.1 DUF4406 domain-containing protein [Citrobacter farmeri]HCB1773499.1 DUF4406 domain-containing protein [Citrobacter farmeri]
MSKKIYIAGPMTGYKDFNRPAFKAFAIKLSLDGNIVLNPAVLPDGLKDREYMDICCAMLRCSDAIFMLRGWQQSDGARAEYLLAKKIGLEIITEFQDVAQ